MFRLNRQVLKTPCDLCKHNHSKRVYGAILDDHIIRCTQAKPLDVLSPTGMRDQFAHKPQEIYVSEEVNGQVNAYVKCPKFELEIDRLEDVVYNKKSFMWQIGYVGLIDMEGNVKTAFDPFQIAINTAKAKMVLNDGGRDNKALRKLYNELQVVYPKIRAEEDPVQLAEAFAAHVCIDVVVYHVMDHPHVFKDHSMQIDTDYTVKSARDWVALMTRSRLNSSPVGHNAKDAEELVEKTIECIKHYNVDFYNLIKQ